MKIAVNTSALTNGDMDFSEFETLGEIKFFGEIPREELKSLAADCDAIVVNKTYVDEDFLLACPKIKYVGVFATGYNVVDLAACRARGITVCNVPDYSTNAVSQHVFALLLNFYNKINEYSASVKAGDWTKSETFTYFPFGTRELYGKTFGVFGYGSIGKAVARIASAFGANVVVSTRTIPEDCPYKIVSFNELLKTCDIVSLHCPLTDATAEIINGETLALMKKDALLINTARGGLVNEAALAKALNEGTIGGACVDVVGEEPILADNPLLTAKNCIITPHCAWVAKETRTRLISLALKNLKAFVDGKPINVVS